MFIIAYIWSIKKIPSSILIALFFIPLICLSWLPKYLKSIKYDVDVSKIKFNKSAIYIIIIFTLSIIITVTSGVYCSR